MINVQELNSLTDIFDYNCGGFALRLLDWYDPESYHSEITNVKNMLEDCANDILADFPELTRVSHYSGIPDELDVIGFRLAVSKSETHDFHFILRSEGNWYHKPGSTKVRKVDFNVDAPWPRGDHPVKYNSTIVWFVRQHLPIGPDDFCPYDYDEEEEEDE